MGRFHSPGPWPLHLLGAPHQGLLHGCPSAGQARAVMRPQPRSLQPHEKSCDIFAQKAGPSGFRGCVISSGSEPTRGWSWGLWRAKQLALGSTGEHSGRDASLGEVFPPPPPPPCLLSPGCSAGRGRGGVTAANCRLGPGWGL